MAHSDLASVPLGLRFVFWGLVLALGAVAAAMAWSAVQMQVPRQAAVLQLLQVIAAAIVLAGVISLIGQILCLTAPSEVGGSFAIYAALVLELTALVLPVASRFKALPPVLANNLFFLFVLGTLYYLLFLRRLAAYLHRPDMATLASNLLVLGLIAVVARGVTIGLSSVGSLLTPIASLASSILVFMGVVLYARILFSLARTAQTRGGPAGEMVPSTMVAAGAVRAGGAAKDVIAATATSPEGQPAPRNRFPLGVAILALLVVAAGAVQFLYPPPQRKAAPPRTGLQAWEGKPCPPVLIKTLDGKVLDLASKHGQCVVLNFWATWCGPCRMELPDFERYFQETRADNVAMIGVADSNESPEDVQAFVAKQQLSYPMGQIALPPPPFSLITGIPTTFVIDRDGVFRTVHVGYCTYEELKSYVDAAQKPAT